MRDQFVEWVTSYPTDPAPRDPAYKSAPVGKLVKRQIPDAIRAAVPEAADLTVRGGIGEGRWTDTPWVALLDPRMAVEDGVYVV